MRIILTITVMRGGWVDWVDRKEKKKFEQSEVEKDKTVKELKSVREQLKGKETKENELEGKVKGFLKELREKNRIIK